MNVGTAICPAQRLLELVLIFQTGQSSPAVDRLCAGFCFSQAVKPDSANSLNQDGAPFSGQSLCARYPICKRVEPGQ